MDVIKVPVKDAERTKRFLSENKIYDHSRIPERIKMDIFFPVLPDIKEYEQNIKFSYSKKALKEVKKNRYEDNIKLPSILRDLLPSSYDILGDIILVDIKNELKTYGKKIGNALLMTHKSIKTVLKKTGIHEGEFRTQKYECIAGIDNRVAIYKENNVILKLDVEKVYFSPRLSTERKRIYEKIKAGEAILVMFSGCAPYPLVISKNTDAKRIVGVEKNPVAHRYAEENLKLNKVNNIELMLGDVNEILPKLKEKFDRIIMPLPKDADTFLDAAFKVSKKGTIIHLYGFEHENEISLGEEKLRGACKKNNVRYKIIETVKCGQFSPGKFRICIDFKIL